MFCLERRSLFLPVLAVGHGTWSFYIGPCGSVVGAVIVSETVHVITTRHGHGRERVRSYEPPTPTG